MRYFILLLFVSLNTFVFSQIDMRMDESVYDFGYIKEADGKVMAELEVRNYSKIPVKIAKIITSCECVFAFGETDFIKPGKTSKISVEYDPTGRPGKFVKSIEIHFAADTSVQTMYLNIKGYTIEKELLEAYVEDLYEGTRLMIKPFESSVLSGSDFRFLHEKDLQFFINDITYEIDQNAFANVQLQLTVDMKDECKIAKDIFPIIHKYISSELERRKYQTWMVGFTDLECKTNGKSIGEPGGKLKVSSRDFNNDTIPESGFYFTGNSIDLSKFQFDRSKDSTYFQKMIVKRVSFSKSKELDIEKNKEYELFIGAIVRRMILDKKASAGVHIHARLHPDSEKQIRNKLTASLNDIYKKINSVVDEEGGVSANLKFSVPVIDFTYDTLLKKGECKDLKYEACAFYKSEITEINNPFNLLMSTDSAEHKNLSDFLNMSGFNAPKQYLPVLEIKHNGILTTDTTSAFFKTWMDIVVNEMKTGKKVEIVIESVTARSALRNNSEIDYEARKNAAKMSSMLKSYLLKLKIPDTMYSFKQEIALSRGEQFSENKFKISSNDDFNYVKIIPCILPNKPSENDVLIPYKINFNNNSYEIPENTSVFQNFISRIIPVLNKQGYVNLIIESSTSKIPSAAFKNNEILTYYRSNDATKKVLAEIKKRGYDPSRIIFSEFRMLVQGPDYKNESDKKIHNYDKYQYVKIIPMELIKE